MPRFLLASARLLVGLALLASSLGASAHTTSPAAPAATIDRLPYVLVGLKGTGALRLDGSVAAADSPLAQTWANVGALGAEALFSGLRSPAVVRLNAEALEVDLRQVYRVSLAPGSGVGAALAALRADPTVVYAEPDGVARQLLGPNDPLYPDQWGLAQISAPAAWNTTTGSASVTVAVIDSGVDTTHPDLAGQLWTNPGEIAGNGVDDDSNGYVDDVHGWNVVDDNADLTDLTGHGTQVAGVIAASGNNGVGVAGVCWACKLMIVKVVQPSGVANYSDIAAGISYAAQKGARVVNISLGGTTDSITLKAAVAAAASGALVVGGAGNDNSATPVYPAAYDDYVLAVAGTTAADTKTANSNYGAWVDLAAPGEAITTTFSGGGYGPSSGTSLAAPFAAGAAALLRSQYPAWSPAQVRAQLEHTADSIDALNPGYGGQLGRGRLDAGAAFAVSPVPELAVAVYAANDQTSAQLTPGTQLTLSVTLRNTWAGAAAVGGSLASGNGSVTVTKNSAAWGPIGAGQSATNSDDPFRVTVAAGAYGQAVPFTLNLLADGQPLTLYFTSTTQSVVQVVSGQISSNTTWTNDRVYHATGHVTVNAGTTLTIQPGTVVKFDSGKALLVNGTLVADGTPSQPILFTSAAANPAPGDWGASAGCPGAGGLLFSASSAPAVFDGTGNWIGGSLLRNVVVEYGKGIANGSGPYLDRVLVQRASQGLYQTFCGAPGTTPETRVTHSRFENNAGVALALMGGLVTIQQNLVAGNGGAIVFMGAAGKVVSNTVTGNGGWGCAAAICNNGGSGLAFQGNSLVANRATFAVGTGSVPMDAAGNYWGTTDPAAIEALIHDQSDDLALGPVTYTPFLSVPDPAAPPIVIQASVSPGSPVGIQRVTFDLTFSAPMDQSLEPVVSFSSGWKTYNAAYSGLPSDYVLSIAVDNGGAKWFGTLMGMGGHATRFDGVNWTVYAAYNSGLPEGAVNAIGIDGDGSKWFGTSNGVARFDGTTWTVYNNANSGLPGNSVSAIAIDRAGAKWFGTWGGGVARFDGTTWTVYNTTNSDLPYDFVTSIAIDSDGSKWFGTINYDGLGGGGGVARFDGITWTVYTTANSGLPDDSISAIAIDRAGVKWFGTYKYGWGSGITRFDGTTWTVYSTANSGLPDNYVSAVAIDSTGSKWFGTVNGLARFDGTAWTVYNIANSGLPDNWVRAMAADSAGTMWFATDKGVTTLGGDRIISDNAQWVDATHWRGTYDITSLVPRGTYSLTASDARSADGMISAGDTGFAFAVDYAGQITDQTAPSRPSVYASGRDGEAGYAAASWQSVDRDLAITGYRYAIGSAPGATDVINWTTTSATTMTRTSLGLVSGQAYWVSVQAQNAGGLWSDIGSGRFVAGETTVYRIYLTIVKR